MIARNRPEPFLSEIASAWFGSKDVASSEMGAFVRLLQSSLELAAEPILAPSGRAAIYFLLRALPLRVLFLPAYTCWVVLEAARLAEKQVVLLDIDYPTMNIQAKEIDRIKKSPGIVLATHQFGFPENIPLLCDQLAGKGHIIIEDCAGAMFSRIGNAAVGTLGDAAIYSFETSKLWSIGRGGCVVTRDPDLARRVREQMRATRASNGRTDLLRLALRRLLTVPAVYQFMLPLYLSVREPTEGMRELSTVLTADYLESISESQMRLGMKLANRVKHIARRRQEAFAVFHTAIGELPGIQRVEALPDSVVTPIRYPILVQGDNKRKLYDRMRASGVDLGFSYTYSLGDRAAYPGAMRFADEVLNLPVYGDITRAVTGRIVATLRRAVGLY